MMKRFIDIHVPVTSCNFKCHYCYVTQMNKNNTEKIKFRYSPKEVQEAFSIKRMGGICLLNICGLGETLIPKEIVEYIEVLLKEGHYVMIVTNGTLTNRFNEIAELDSLLLKHLFFKFSFHYLELKRLNLMETFISNVNHMKDVGCSYTIEITPNDELESYIEDIKQICVENFGAPCHVTIPRKENDKIIPLLSKHSIDEFYTIWSTFDSKLLDFKKMIWGVKRREFCHAGEWSGLLDLGTGLWTPCYSIRAQKQNFFSEDFEFYPVGKHCNMPHCYNGHSFLSLGNIPEINTYHFDELRNRKCSDGTMWLSLEMEKFFNERLEESNSYRYSLSKQIHNYFIKNRIYLKNIINKVFRHY